MRPFPRTRAFTLVELLVIIAIIMILVSIMMPSLREARHAARCAVCRGELHDLGSALVQFSSAHQSVLPGLWGPPCTGTGEEDWQGSWMGEEVFTTSYQPPPAAKPGTLMPYIGTPDTARRYYLCPAQEKSEWGDGKGSNGLFDCTMVQAFPGARTILIPLESSVKMPGTGEWVSAPTPIIVEEDPAYHINSIFFDMGHTTINRLGRWHSGGSAQYIALDGSVYRMMLGESLGPQTYDWMTRAPSGEMQSLGQTLPYGAWNTK